MKIILKDLYNDENYYLTIDDSQYKLLDWLFNNGMLNNYDLVEITDDIWEKIV